MSALRDIQGGRSGRGQRNKMSALILVLALLQAAPFRRFVEMVRSNSHDFEAQGRVLRLKQYISADVRPAAINAILEALAVNTLVEVLYIQNFEQVGHA